eukprot:scaffold14580_cov269-Alexandrium_tamarense.AAC.2
MISRGQSDLQSEKGTNLPAPFEPQPPTTALPTPRGRPPSPSNQQRKTHAISRWQDVWLRFMARKRTRYVSSRISGVEQILCTSDGRSCGLSSC